MIYLVSKNIKLFSPEHYKQISLEEAFNILKPIKLVQFDTETLGLNCHSKALLTIQLGNKENQVVLDWTTLSKEEKIEVKKYLESPNITLLGWNLSFDLTFLYKQDIWPKNLIDGMIVDQLLFLGLPRVLTTDLYTGQFGYEPVIDESNGKLKHWELRYSLKAAAKRWCNLEIDKSVRGQIITQGLTEAVVVYSATDVMYIEDIYNAQMIEVEKQHLSKAATFECEAIKSVAYTKFCGVHLDSTKWKSKMEKDQSKFNAAINALNEYTLNLYKQDSSKYKPFVKWVDADLFGFVQAGYSCNINWSSQKQVIPLFKLLGIKTKTFDKKTRKEKDSIEEKMIAPQKDDFPIIPLFLDYQKYAKLTSGYGINWLNAIDPNTGRLHLELHSIGTDTARMSSGGGVYRLNLQNLPNDEVTRSCFTAEKGNVWLSCDYSGQESRLIASVSKDKAMIEELSKPNGDIHSLVAYKSYPNIIPRDTKIEDIKKLYHDARQDSKGIEFSINYGGNAHTIANNKGIPIEQAEKIYNDFMAGFPGLCRYQQYCRQVVLEKGYILMNPLLGHRAHIYDADEIIRINNKLKDPEFNTYYWQMKKQSPHCETVESVKRFNKRKQDIGKQSINYRIQNRGACCLKLALIKFFNWIVANNYQNIVKICVLAHDELNSECPKAMKDEVSNIILKCMEAGGKPFCPNVHLGADMEIGDHWIH